jgi:hypothetical protein
VQQALLPVSAQAQRVCPAGHTRRQLIFAKIVLPPVGTAAAASPACVVTGIALLPIRSWACDGQSRIVPSSNRAKMMRIDFLPSAPADPRGTRDRI